MRGGEIMRRGRVPNFEQMNYSAEDGTRRNDPLFRRKSACFAKQKTYGIPFRVIPRVKIFAGILFRYNICVILFRFELFHTFKSVKYT